jgi:hypothetical protein
MAIVHDLQKPMSAGEKAGNTKEEHVVPGEALHRAILLHHHYLRQDRHRLDVNAERPEKSIDECMPRLRMRNKSEEDARDNLQDTA